MIKETSADDNKSTMKTISLSNQVSCIEFIDKSDSNESEFEQPIWSDWIYDDQIESQLKNDVD